MRWVVVVLLGIILLTSSVISDTITSIKADDPSDETHSDEEDSWRREAVNKLWTEREQMGHTPLIKFPMKGFPEVDLFFKNETAAKTRTLKHRFAWALIMWALVEGKVSKNSTVYDSTSGNTGASEAYMCSLVGVPFVAVVAKELEDAKVSQITSNGGTIMKVDVSLRNFHAENEAKKNNGFFINQFGNADRAEEFHESGDYKSESTNVFHEILAQLKTIQNNQSYPDYFVHSAGTGGTISSVGRYIRHYNVPTKVVLADSEFSLFHDYVIHNKFANESGNDLWVSPGVAGIGYGYNVKPVIFGETTSLVRTVIDESMKMPDIATVAAMRVLRNRGIGGGASTALNFLVSLQKALDHKSQVDRNEDKTESDSNRLTIATLICDPSEFYDSTYNNDSWIEKQFKKRGGVEVVECWERVIESTLDTGSDLLSKGLRLCVHEEQ